MRSGLLMHSQCDVLRMSLSTETRNRVSPPQDDMQSYAIPHPNSPFPHFLPQIYQGYSSPPLEVLEAGPYSCGPQQIYALSSRQGRVTIGIPGLRQPILYGTG